MELFLNNSNESFLVDLLASYLALYSKKTVLPIHLSRTALSLIEKNVLKLSNPPFLICEDENILITPETISIYLIELSFTEQIMLGKTKEEEAQVLSVFEICKRKNQEEILNHYNELLKKNSFIVGYHVTLADLVLFVHLNDALFSMKDSDKLKNNNILRWYLHIQSIDSISKYLNLHNKGIIELPEKLEEEKKKEKK